MPAGDGAPSVPLDLGVVVGVQVDETRRDDEATRVEDLIGGCRLAIPEPPDLGDLPVLDRDVGDVAWDAGAVHHGAALDDDVVLSHVVLPRDVDGAVRLTRTVSRMMLW